MSLLLLLIIIIIAIVPVIAIFLQVDGVEKREEAGIKILNCLVVMVFFCDLNINQLIEKVEFLNFLKLDFCKQTS